MKSLIILFFISLLVLTNCSSGPGRFDTFAQCLSEKGAVMYGTEWCSHCKAQKKDFGSSFQYINFIDCDLQKDECTKAGVKGYPTWNIDGENYPGQQAFYKLSQVSGCELQ